MAIKCGIVGLPNVGKSTLFNALTRTQQAQAENYAFCTIEPNVGIVEIPDPRFDQIIDIVKPKKHISATMEFVDIAGLVEGASKGEGLGNKFLSHIREVDAIAHVVRAFEDENVAHVSSQVNPTSDIETINIELILADLETIEKTQLRVQKASKSGNKENIMLGQLLEKVKAHLQQGLMLKSLELNTDELKQIKSLCLLSIKPTLYVANVGDNAIEGNYHVEAIQQLATKESSQVVVVCAGIEQELSELEQQDAQLFLQEIGLTEPGLNRVIRSAYKLLGLQTYFTAGPNEARAWPTRTGSSAPQAAGVIHSDFERGFICAETISYEDYLTYKGEQGAKQAGKLRLEGKEYIVQDGDVMHFRFNV